jgi:hypothetical protein
MIISNRLPATTSHSYGYDWWAGGESCPFWHQFIELVRKTLTEPQRIVLGDAVAPCSCNDAVATAGVSLYNVKVKNKAIPVTGQEGP